MPTRFTIYRVMIGSPSDLAEERQAATDAVNEWTAQHADAAGAVLVPVKWETHALPTSGVMPQSAINNQLVDRCDILIGMFGTKRRCRGHSARNGRSRSTSDYPYEAKLPATDSIQRQFQNTIISQLIYFGH